MSSYLAYSYSTELSDENRVANNLRVNCNRKEAMQGALFALALYSIYRLIVEPVDPSDHGPNPGQGEFPGQSTPGNQVVPAPPKKGLNDMQKDTYTGSTTSICALAIQTSNFWLGFAGVGLLIIGSKIMTDE